MNEKLLAELIGLLSGSHAERETACAELLRYGSASVAALPAIIGALALCQRPEDSDEFRTVRHTAAMLALDAGFVSQEDREAMAEKLFAEFETLLSSPVDDVREMAASALATMGLTWSIPLMVKIKLRAMFNDSVPRCRSAARHAVDMAQY